MIILEDKVFFETLEILRGNSNLLPIYAELRDFIKNEYNIDAINFEIEKRAQGGYPYHLMVIISDEEGYKKILSQDGWNFQPSKQKAIANKFYELAKKYEFASLSSLNDVYIYYCDFSSELKTHVNWSLENEISNLITTKYAELGIWRVEFPLFEIYVFFDTNAQMAENSQNGVCEKIRRDCFEMIEKHDEFSYFKDHDFIKFDSKENVDEKYEGSLFLYFC